MLPNPLLYVFLIQLKLAATSAKQTSGNKHPVRCNGDSLGGLRMQSNTQHSIAHTHTHTFNSQLHTNTILLSCKHMFTLVLVLMLTVTTFACSLFGFVQPQPPLSNVFNWADWSCFIFFFCYATVKTCQASMSPCMYVSMRTSVCVFVWVSFRLRFCFFASMSELLWSLDFINNSAAKIQHFITSILSINPIDLILNKLRLIAFRKSFRSSTNSHWKLLFYTLLVH